MKTINSVISRINRISRASINCIFNILHGVENILVWLPVIWSDRNYSPDGIYNVLNKKLSKMERYFRGGGVFIRSEDALEIANQIMEAKECAQRLIDDAYLDDLTRDIRTDEIFSIRNRKWHTDRDHPQYEEWERSVALSAQLREQDRLDLFKMLSDNSNSWWD